MIYHQLISGKMEEKSSTGEYDAQDELRFFTVFPAILFSSELKAKFYNQNVYFHQY
jgi:hypothetical protein